MLDQLTTEEKLRLLRFVCAFAWADLDIAERERNLVMGLIGKIGLSDEDAAHAAKWLDHPPREDELDPYEIPLEHRKLFLDAALEMVGVDGVVDEAEAESFTIFEALMGVTSDDD